MRRTRACSWTTYTETARNDRQVVDCCEVARTPAGGPEMPQAQRNLVLDILSLGVSTGQLASAYILTNYERECADPLVFERGLARGRAEPSDFEGGSAHTNYQIVDLEKDMREAVLTPRDRESCLLSFTVKAQVTSPVPENVARTEDLTDSSTLLFVVDGLGAGLDPSNLCKPCKDLDI